MDADEELELRLMREETRQQIENNSPDLIRLHVRPCNHVDPEWRHYHYRPYQPNGGDWARDGESIGTNTQLKEVEFTDSENFAKEDVGIFFLGLGANHSIRKLTLSRLRDGEVFTSLVPLFYNKNLESLGICRPCHHADFLRLLALALAGFDSLKRFRLNMSRLDMPREFDLDEVIQTLAGHTGLEEIHLANTRWVGNTLVGANDVKAPVKLDLALLFHPSFTGLKKIGLSHFPFGIRELCALSTLLENPSCKLEVLELNSCVVDDRGAEVLASGLVECSTLKELDISGRNESMSNTGWEALFDTLRSRTCGLANLRLAHNEIGKIISLPSALSFNGTLRALDLSFLGGVINDELWQDVFQFLQSPNSALEFIDLSFGRFNDSTFNALTNALIRNKKLKELGLQEVQGEVGVSAAAWVSFSAVLQNTDSALEVIYAPENNVGSNEVMSAFAHALVNNEMLRELDLTVNSPDLAVDDAGWEAFLPVLCDDSSIMATYQSNHTLESLWNEDYSDPPPDDSMSEDIRTLLLINKENSKSQAARLKIIETHFNSTTISSNMQTFTDMDLEVLPHALAWIGRDGIDTEGTWATGFELLYQVLQESVTKMSR